MKYASKYIALLLGLIVTAVSAAPVGMYEDTLQYDYDLAGNLINRWGGDSNKNYTYDSLYRLILESDDTGSVQSFTYDSIGNRLSDDLNGQSTTYQYSLENSHLLSQGSNTYTRDAVGNTVSDHSGARTFTYTPDNRIHQIFDNGVLIATYTYNALGQRTQKTTPQSTTYYVYGLSGELQGEYDQNGNVIREYVYLNGEPLAQLNADDSVTYLHTDHLGTPRRATDESGEVVWSWNSDAFGVTPADTDPDGDGQITQVNLRFPGQYYDQETGLHYNYYRYYDPQTGRYMTSDPIGLNGGLNTFGYVLQNPLAGVDVYGLNTLNVRVMVLLGQGRLQEAITVASAAGLPIASRLQQLQNAIQAAITKNPLSSNNCAQLAQTIGNAFSQYGSKINPTFLRLNPTQTPNMYIGNSYVAPQHFVIRVGDRVYDAFTGVSGMAYSQYVNMLNAANGGAGAYTIQTVKNIGDWL